MWKSTNIFLRPVTLIDLQTLLEWENNPDNWEISGTTAPFSEEEMIDFIIEQADYKATRQLRLMICMNEQLILHPSPCKNRRKPDSCACNGWRTFCSFSLRWHCLHGCMADRAGNVCF